MSKELFVSSTPHETKVAVVEDDQLSEIYYERENEYTLAGSIYKGRVTRVLPGMQSAFVNIGLERDAFLYVSDFLLEEEDVEGLDQVVARSRIIESPSPEEPSEERAPDSHRPLEADEIIPPAEAAGEGAPAEHRAAEVENVEPAGGSTQSEEQEREGARKCGDAVAAGVVVAVSKTTPAKNAAGITSESVPRISPVSIRWRARRPSPSKRRGRMSVLQSSNRRSCCPASPSPSTSRAQPSPQLQRSRRR